MIRAGFETVSGTIIGYDGRIEWQLYYQGRPQCEKCYADTEEQAIADATARMHAIKRECLNDKTGIYDNNVKWEVRLW